LDHFLRDADFFSIGTNDLIQYTMAVDRANSRVNDLFVAEHPAVLRLLRWTIRSANSHQIPVCLCGQMGGDPYGVVLLLGLGLRNMSCSSNNIARVKTICRQLSIDDCRKIVRDAMQMRNASDIQQFVKVRVHELLPDLFGKREE
jgi:phosphoenolpyruvate-protein kinase (PTS system EI component)